MKRLIVLLAGIVLILQPQRAALAGAKVGPIANRSGGAGLQETRD